MSDDKIFANGLIVKAPRESAPEFVKATLSIKSDDFIRFLETHTKGDGWCNIDIKEGRSGKWYAELNTWNKKAAPRPEAPQRRQAPYYSEEEAPF